MQYYTLFRKFIAKGYQMPEQLLLYPSRRKYLLFSTGVSIESVNLMGIPWIVLAEKTPQYPFEHIPEVRSQCTLLLAYCFIVSSSLHLLWLLVKYLDVSLIPRMLKCESSLI